jgi:alanine racemase
VTNWVEISEERLGANYRTLCEAGGAEVSVLAVIKADAYGHGTDLCAPVLARAGATWLGVTNAAEGAGVRAALVKAGIAFDKQPRILVMSGSLPDEAATIVEHDLTPVVWTAEQMRPLAAVALKQAKPLAVHLEVDTGMSRQGATVGAELEAALRWLAEQSTLRLECVMTHFASAEVAGSHQTSEQQAQFEQAMQQVAASGLRPELMSAGNTSALDNVAKVTGLAVANEGVNSLAWLRQLAARSGARAMVRTGLGLYGYCLPVEHETGFSGAVESAVRPRLHPVMAWKARVIGLREIAAGTLVGYGGTFTAKQPMRLALLPVGYADGLRRSLSSAGTSHDASSAGGWLMLGGQPAPVVGRISMNLTIVDVTEIPGVAVGDDAVVLGAGITAEDHARLAGTIPYEILCGVKVSRRLV